MAQRVGSGKFGDSCLSPEDSSREEIIRELAFHAMVERGLADSDAKRAISNEEMGRRIRSWQK